MVNVGIKLEIDPKIIEKISSEQEILWAAAHEDGSNNLIDGEEIIDAASWDLGLGAVTAGFLGVRKLYRNRGKTKEDLAAEKEARKINDACGSLAVILPDYLRQAQEGVVDENLIVFMIARMEELQDYSESGKMIIPGKEELIAVRKSITAFTTAIAGEESVPQSETPEADEFGLIKEQLIRQRDLIEGLS